MNEFIVEWVCNASEAVMERAEATREEVACFINVHEHRTYTGEHDGVNMKIRHIDTGKEVPEITRFELNSLAREMNTL